MSSWARSTSTRFKGERGSSRINGSYSIKQSQSKRREDSRVIGSSSFPASSTRSTPPEKVYSESHSQGKKNGKLKLNSKKYTDNRKNAAVESRIHQKGHVDNNIQTYHSSQGYSSAARACMSNHRPVYPPLPETPATPNSPKTPHIPHSCRDDLVTKLCFDDGNDGEKYPKDNSTSDTAPTLRRTDSIPQGGNDDGQTVYSVSSVADDAPQGLTTPLAKGNGYDAREELFRSSIKKAIKAQTVLKQRLCTLEEQRKSDIRRGEDKVNEITEKLLLALNNCENAETGWTLELSQKTAALEKANQLKREMKEKEMIALAKQMQFQRDKDIEMEAWKKQFESETNISWMKKIKKVKESVFKYKDQIETLKAKVELSDEKIKLADMEFSAKSEKYNELRKVSAKQRKELIRIDDENFNLFQKVKSLAGKLRASQKAAEKSCIDANESALAAEEAAISAQAMADALDIERFRVLQLEENTQVLLQRLHQAEMEAETYSQSTASTTELKEKLDNVNETARNAILQLELEKGSRNEEINRLKSSHAYALQMCHDIAEAEMIKSAVDAERNQNHAIEKLCSEYEFKIQALLLQADNDCISAVEASIGASEAENGKLKKENTVLKALNKKCESEIKELIHIKKKTNADVNLLDAKSANIRHRLQHETVLAEVKQFGRFRAMNKSKTTKVVSQMTTEMNRRMDRVIEDCVKETRIKEEKKFTNVKEKLFAKYQNEIEQYKKSAQLEISRLTLMLENQSKSIEISEAEQMLQREEHEMQLLAMDDYHTHEMNQRIIDTEKHTRCTIASEFSALNQSEILNLRSQIKQCTASLKSLEASNKNMKHELNAAKIKVRDMTKENLENIKNLKQFHAHEIEALHDDLVTNGNLKNAHELQGRVSPLKTLSEESQRRSSVSGFSETNRRSSVSGFARTTKASAAKASAFNAHAKKRKFNSSAKRVVKDDLKLTKGKEKHESVSNDRLATAQIKAQLRNEVRRRKTAEAKSAELKRQLEEATQKKKHESSNSHKTFQSQRQNIQRNTRLKLSRKECELKKSLGRRKELEARVNRMNSTSCGRVIHNEGGIPKKTKTTKSRIIPKSSTIKSKRIFSSGIPTSRKVLSSVPIQKEKNFSRSNPRNASALGISRRMTLQKKKRANKEN